MYLMIGIDPGSVTGIGFWFYPEKRLQVQQKKHTDAMFYLDEYLKKWPKGNFKFFIEDARKYKKNAYFAKIDPLGKRKQGAGSVKARCSDWENFCKQRNFQYQMLPLGTVNTKMSKEDFEKTTRIKTLKTHTHARDAGLIVLNRNKF